MKRLFRVLTFANVCSFLALAVALSTGGAYAANTVFSTDIVNGEVKTPDLATDAVASPKILDGAVKSLDLNDDSVTAAKIVTDGVRASEVAENAIDTDEVAPDSLFAGDIAADQVRSSEIAANAVGGSEIDAGAVGASEIASNAVGGGDVANDSLTLSDINGVNIAGTITVSAGVANGRCVDLTLTTPGTEVGDAVVLSLRADVADGLVFSGVRVPADGQTVAKMCNLTGAASPAVNQLPIRVVTFG